MSKKIWLSVTYVPGVDNDADYESRNYRDNLEWMLERNVAEQIMCIWDRLEIDMFASRLNRQTDRFVSWRPDPNVEFVDAFSVNWENLYFYAFPPFSFIRRLLV